MPEHISPTKQSALIHDLINAEFDLTMIRSHYGVSPRGLAAWVLEESNYRALTGLCVITDFQTQLMLSRYRINAVAKLFAQVDMETEDDKAKEEMVRRACVDLLKIDLPRTELDPKLLTAAEEPEPDDELQALLERIERDARQSAGTDTQAYDHPAPAPGIPAPDSGSGA